jgi:hypothetical protein
MENKLSEAPGQYLFWKPVKKNIPETGLLCRGKIRFHLAPSNRGAIALGAIT